MLQFSKITAHPSKHIPSKYSRNCSMTYATLPGLTVFCVVSSITPGPNNLMLMALGAY